MKILIVDDEPINLTILNKMLTYEGYEVVVAVDGLDAISKVEQCTPDLILMDIMMPKMGGYEATEIIKKKFEGKFLPILFVSALSANDALLDSLAYGGDDYISKPINKDVLIAKIVAMERIIRLTQTIEDQNKKLTDRQLQVAEEKRIAEEIFSKLLHLNEMDSDFIRCYHRAADTFSGDVTLAVSSPRGGMNVLLGDFTGHGLVAAVCTLPVVEMFHAMSSKGYTIKDILYEINQKIVTILPPGRFLAINLLHINRKEGFLEIANAGMPDVYLFHQTQGIKKRFSSQNIPLGILGNHALTVNFEFCEIENGDRIFAYSDGLLEAENKSQTEFYGQDRLEDMIETHLNVSNMVSCIQADLELFSENENYSDDVSLVEIICDAPQKKLNFTPKKEKDIIGNWEFSVHLDYLKLKDEDSVPLIISMLIGIDRRNAKRSVLLLLITEMFNNALEHGILQLDANEISTKEGFISYYQKKKTRLAELDNGYIKLNFRQEKVGDGGKLYITLEDSGEGFDTKKVRENTSDFNIDAVRGLKLIQSVCSFVEFNDQGNQIQVVLDC